MEPFNLAFPVAGHLGEHLAVGLAFLLQGCGQGLGVKPVTGHFAHVGVEIVAHGDLKTSKVVGRRIGDVALPEGASIAAVIRGGEEVLIAHHDTLIEAEDHVIVFALSKRIIPKVEKLFQVGFGFF